MGSVRLDGRRPWDAGDDRDLADEVALREVRDALTAANHVRAAVQQHEELAPSLALPDDLLVAGKVDFVRERSHLGQLLARQPCEERDVLDQLNLGVLTYTHPSESRTDNPIGTGPRTLGLCDDY